MRDQLEMSGGTRRYVYVVGVLVFIYYCLCTSALKTAKWPQEFLKKPTRASHASVSRRSSRSSKSCSSDRSSNLLQPAPAALRRKSSRLVSGSIISSRQLLAAPTIADSSSTSSLKPSRDSSVHATAPPAFKKSSSGSSSSSFLHSVVLGVGIAFAIGLGSLPKTADAAQKDPRAEYVESFTSPKAKTANKAKEFHSLSELVSTLHS